MTYVIHEKKFDLSKKLSNGGVYELYDIYNTIQTQEHLRLSLFQGFGFSYQRFGGQFPVILSNIKQTKTRKHISRHYSNIL